MKIISDDNDGIFDQFQLETDLAEREQRDVVRASEVEFLNQAETQADYCQAMKAKDFYLVESPDAPLDEVSYRDFKIRRAAGEGR